jgi:hypothetical protein
MNEWLEDMYADGDDVGGVGLRRRRTGTVSRDSPLCPIERWMSKLQVGRALGLLQHHHLGHRQSRIQLERSDHVSTEAPYNPVLAISRSFCQATALGASSTISLVGFPSNRWWRISLALQSSRKPTCMHRNTVYSVYGIVFAC